MPEVKGRLYASTDITEWGELYKQHKPTIRNEDDIIALIVEQGFKTGEVGKMIVAGRELGEVPDDIIDTSEALLYAAARSAVNRIIANSKSEVELENGCAIVVRDLISGPNGTFLRYDTPDGLDSVMNYLVNTVPGHVCERLEQIAAAGGDVRDAADALIKEVEVIVERLT